MKPSPFQRFLGELRRRHVPQTAAIYLVAAWAMIQFADVVVPNLDGPQWVITAVIVAAAAGFPVVLILAWIFEWGRDGLHRTPGTGPPGAADAPGGPDRVPPESSGPWITAVAVLLVGIASALGVAVVLDSADEGAPEREAAADGAPGSEEDDDDGSGPGQPMIPPLPPEIMSGEWADEVRRSVLSRSLSGLGALDSLAEARDVQRRFGTDRAILIAQPTGWTLGSGPVPLPAGDTLVVQGIARDPTDGAGVAAVLMDGRVVAERDGPSPILEFRTTLVGTGSAGERTVRFTVRMADGREVVREYEIIQVPGG